MYLNVPPQPLYVEILNLLGDLFFMINRYEIKYDNRSDADYLLSFYNSFNSLRELAVKKPNIFMEELYKAINIYLGQAKIYSRNPRKENEVFLINSTLALKMIELKSLANFEKSYVLKLLPSYSDWIKASKIEIQYLLVNKRKKAKTKINELRSILEVAKAYAYYSHLEDDTYKNNFGLFIENTTIELKKLADS